MGITEHTIAMSKRSSSQPLKETGKSVWAAQGATYMEEPTYNGLKVIGWAIFIAATLYLLI